MATEASKQLKLFYCYARRDKALRDELDEHLSLLKRQHQITSWYDREISPGTNWEQEIDTQLNSAHIILLLVSASFMASDYCYGIEMKRALERHSVGTARVIPIILRPVDWENAPFSPLQVLPTDAKPVTLWHNPDEAFWNITQGIRKSINELKELLKANEQEKINWYYKGVALAGLKRYEEALTAYEQALKLDSTYVHVWNSKGFALNNLGRYEEALPALEQALKLDPTYVYAWNNKGVALNNLGRYEEALPALEQALKLDPTDVDVWNNKGVALEGLKRYEEALMAYEQALKLDPNHILARNNRTSLLKELKRI